MGVPWDEPFEKLMRTYVDVPAGTALDPEADLVTLGLDSRSMVELLIDVEERYNFTFPGDLLAAEGFGNLTQLWSRISELRTA